MSMPIFVVFREQYESVFELKEIESTIKKEAFTACQTYFRSKERLHILDCLACLRILSRDSDFQKYFANSDILSTLLREAGLIDLETFDCTGIEEVVIESLKCLSNIIFKNPALISSLRSNGCIETIINRCKQRVKDRQTSDILIFDTKLLFLVSALDPTARLEILSTYMVSNTFVELLEFGTDADFATCPRVLQYVVELLKVLFNLGYANKEAGYNELFYRETYIDLTRQVRFLLCKSSLPSEPRLTLQNHCVNFLTTVPPTCFAYLLFDTDGIEEPYKDTRVCLALASLLEFLEHQLIQSDSVPSSDADSAELLTPILNVIAFASRANRIIRKFFRLKILPSLGIDAKRLPESGNTLRNRICRRLTATHNSDGVAEATALVIFVLCKENGAPSATWAFSILLTSFFYPVDRAIKYSGFGNFSGFLARHGLMRSAGSAGREQIDEMAAYSTDSSDSETEEYQRLKQYVNPVTGCFELPKPNPMENMSEEQKEYEAMKLVEKIDQLHRSGLIKPGAIGEDGRVHPVEHILELVKNVSIDSNGDNENESS